MRLGESAEQLLTRIYSRDIIWNRKCFDKEAVCIFKRNMSCNANVVTK